MALNCRRTGIQIQFNCLIANYNSKKKWSLILRIEFNRILSSNLIYYSLLFFNTSFSLFLSLEIKYLLLIKSFWSDCRCCLCHPLDSKLVCFVNSPIMENISTSNVLHLSLVQCWSVFSFPSIQSPCVIQCSISLITELPKQSINF